MVLRRFATWAVVVVAVGILPLACSPKIYEFSVWPRRACPDDTIHISFDARGEAHLTVMTHGSDDADTITYTLIVERNGDQEFARQDVVRRRTTPQNTLVFMTSALGSDSLLAESTLSEETWNSGLTIGTIASLSGRPVRVAHDGREATLGGDGSPSTAFEGSAVQGTWQLKAALVSGEVMGDPRHAPPDRLKLAVTLECGGQTP